MPIRTDRGRAAATRAFWSWPLRSGRHMLATVVVAAAVLTGVALASNALQGNPSSAAVPPAADSAAATTTPPQPLPPAGKFGSEVLPTSSPTSAGPSTTPTTVAAGATSAGSAGALVTAKEFMAHWVRPAAGTTTSQWADGLRIYVMPESIAELDTVDPQNIPATKVTGDPQVTTSSAAVVEANVPTDAGATHLVIVAYTDGRWLVRTWEPV